MAAAKKSIREKRKAEIIKAFYIVAKKEGLENASIAKVADQAKINPSLIIHYFKNREGLLLALNDFILERYLRIYKVNGSAVNSKERLVQLIENLFSRKWNRLFDDGVFYSCYAQIYRNDHFKQSFKKLHDLLHEKLKNALDEALENNVITHEDTKQLAQTIFALLDGAYYYLGMVEDKAVYDERLETYKKLVMKELHLQ